MLAGGRRGGIALGASFFHTPFPRMKEPSDRTVVLVPHEDGVGTRRGELSPGDLEEQPGVDAPGRPMGSANGFVEPFGSPGFSQQLRAGRQRHELQGNKLATPLVRAKSRLRVSRHRKPVPVSEPGPRRSGIECRGLLHDLLRPFQVPSLHRFGCRGQCESCGDGPPAGRGVGRNAGEGEREPQG